VYYDANTGTNPVTLIASSSGLSGPRGIAVDSNNNMYIVNNGNRSVSRYNLSNGSEEEREEVVKLNRKIGITEGLYQLPSCINPDASIYEILGEYTVYHFALETEDENENFGVYANGRLVETCSIYNLQNHAKMNVIS